MRGDAPVVRYLCETRGQQEAVAWQRKPHVLFPATKLLETLSSGDPDESLFQTEADAMPQIDLLPWSDFTIDLGRSFERVADNFERPLTPDHPLYPFLEPLFGGTWARVSEMRAVTHTACPHCAGPHLDERLAEILEHLAENDRTHDEFVHILLYHENVLRIPGHLIPSPSGVLPYLPLLYLVPKADPWNPEGRIVSTFQGPDTDSDKAYAERLADMMDICVDLALAATARILYGIEHPVEVRPTAKRDKKGERTPKPWTREDLPHIITIDPARVGEYRPSTPGQGGTHATPRPHCRRAHFRTLRAERYGDNRGRRIPVRQMWVGETEWQRDGSVYRVLDPATMRPRTR